MALAPKQPNQATQREIKPQVPQSQANKALPNRVYIKTTSTTQTQNIRFDRASTQRQSRSNHLEASKDSTKSAGQTPSNKHFTNRCRVELLSLLESIKPDYHNAIKNLYGDPAHADLFIKIGEEDLGKPLHRCILAARAFKFYSALKYFNRNQADLDSLSGNTISSPTNYDVDKTSISLTAADKTLNSEGDFLQSEQILESESIQKGEQNILEALKLSHFELPGGLISCEHFLSFARRAYIDQDLFEDEIHLNLTLLNWIKLNKPELLKLSNSVKHSPDHRESFRTIQPGFEQLSISDGSNSPVMSANEHSFTGQLKTGFVSAESNTDDLPGDTSRASSIPGDESHVVMSLTRTETFEMLPRNNPDSQLFDANTTNNEEDPNLEDDDKDRSEFSINTSESSEPCTPVTRTGLKPKKFTPVVGLRTNRTSKNAISSKKKIESQDGESPNVSTTAGYTVTRSDNLNKSSSGVSSNLNSTASKRSSLAPAAQSPNSTDFAISTPKNLITSTPKASRPRQTIITRAHPISLERSQSPGTSLSKGSTKNFIAANKKLISQMEKKVQSIHQADQKIQGNDDSENDVSDASLLALTEPLTTENLAAQVDKFALVSYSKLADALSHMLIGRVLTDMVVLAKDGKQIDAHRCILAARSAYLQDQINKQCLPSMTPETPSSNRQLIIIDLSEYSYEAVYFALMHIYSGFVKVPEDLELEELTKLSHLLHVCTLKQVCMHNLQMNYCHYFHKPCNVCCVGVLKTLPIAWRYDLTELYTKCLQWIGTNFAQIFCLEEFSYLKPHDLIEECYKETLTQLTPDNVISRTIECQKLLKSLPRVKWTESVICLVGRQLEDFCHYVADNYEKILRSESFLNLGKSCWECEVLEENLLAAMNLLKPDAGCKTLIELDKIECSIETYCEEPRTVSDTFANLISKMRKYCERFLLKEAAAVVHCSSWRQMSPSLQKRIKDQALLSTDFDEPTRQLATKPKLPSMARHQQHVTSRASPSPQPNYSSSEARSPSNRSTPDSRLKSPNTIYLPPPKTKQAAARHVKVLR